MTVNVIVRKGAVAVITESLAEKALDDNRTVNIDLKPGAIAVVLEDGASPAEVKTLIA